MTLAQLSTDIHLSGLLPEEGVSGDRLQANSVSRSHLQAQAVDSEVLSPEAVGPEHLQAAAVQSHHVAEQSIEGHHLVEGSVGSRELELNAVKPEHLSITPVRTCANQPALQQFGRAPFLLKGSEGETEVTIVFGEPFVNPDYTLVAMTNHPLFHATLKSQTPNGAVIVVTKWNETAHNYGIISWIAIG